jgi:hypothetical protein
MKPSCRVSRAKLTNVGVGVLEIPVLRFRVIDQPFDHVRVLLRHPNITHRLSSDATHDFSHPPATVPNGGMETRRRDAAARGRYHVPVHLKLVPEIRRLCGRGNEIRSASDEGIGREGGKGGRELTSW